MPPGAFSVWDYLLESNHSGSYHWEMHHPSAEVDCQLANNDFLQKSVIPSHFELFYKNYDCVIDKHTKVVSTSLHQIISTFLDLTQGED